jgi:hypothetical protein
VEHGAVEAGRERSGERKIRVTRTVRVVHPVVATIARDLAEIDRISVVRISPGLLQASSEAAGGGVGNPITTPGHPTAIGISLIPDPDLQEVLFHEITSALKGYGGRMVAAVLGALPEGWSGVVVMDWSSGFWERMMARHRNLVIM